MKNISTTFVSGYAQAPKGTSLWESGSLFGIMLEIDKETHKIVNADCTFVTKLARDYLSKLIVGEDFLNDFDNIVISIKSNMFIPTTNTIIVAIKIAHQRYLDSIK